MSKQTWFSIKNAAADPDTAEISIYDTIGSYGLTAKDFIGQLKATNAKNIDLHINSPGGSVFDGNAIFNALQRHPANITTHVDGLAASIASVIAMAGDVVHMPANALMMIHNPSDMAFGGADDMRQCADLLDKVKGTIISAYDQKTGLGSDKLGQMMDDETWMTAGEAYELGFADSIGEPVTATACFDLKPKVDKTKGGMALKDILAKLGKTQPKAEEKAVVKTDETTKTEGSDPATKTEEKKTEGGEGTKKEDATTPTVETLTNSVTTMRNELTTLRAEHASLKTAHETVKAEKAALETEIKDATEIANKIIASMPIDQPLPRTNASEQEGSGAPATCEAFIAEYRRLQKEETTAKATAFYSKHGKKFGF